MPRNDRLRIENGRLVANRALAHCIATDAANAAMRRAYRTAWNPDDANLYTDTFVRVWPLEAEYPWATPEQIARMRQDLGYDAT